MDNDVIGWILAWKPEKGEYFNFEFFQEKGVSGEKCKYSYLPFGTENEESIICLNEVEAKERVHYELQLFKQGKLKKYFMNVVDAYIMPVIGKDR